jgi:hypothetical protein
LPFFVGLPAWLDAASPAMGTDRELAQPRDRSAIEHDKNLTAFRGDLEPNPAQFLSQ